MKKACLFIDRDGTLIVEPADQQIDSLEKLEFYPKVFQGMHAIAHKLDFELVMVTNQDGLGTASFPEADFWPAHHKMLQSLEHEGVVFADIHIDRSLPADNAPTRKPGVGMLGQYLTGDYDLAASYTIGDRLTDVQLAKNLGCKAILMATPDSRQAVDEAGLTDVCALITTDWVQVYDFLQGETRRAHVERHTSETQITIDLNLDGTGRSEISTGVGFFDHMLDQIARHSGCDLRIQVKGDLHIDQHHTIEDTGIALGEAFAKALGSKRGIERYGFVLPMDDCLCQVALDFGGRAWLVFDAEFTREMIGDFPTEMIHHFFKSLSDGARMNLNIQAQGYNEHHKLEGIFKALARAIKSAIHRNPFAYTLPSTKGVL